MRSQFSYTDVMMNMDLLAVVTPPCIYQWYSLDDIYVCVELLADDVWESEDDKTGFFSVGVDNLDRLFL